MLKIVWLQLAGTLLVSVVLSLFAGAPAFFSALMGGLCCVIPNGLFALRLIVNLRRENASPLVFFAGEMIKIVSTVALLFVVAKLYRDLNWWALLLGFVVALKNYFILLIRH